MKQYVIDRKTRKWSLDELGLNGGLSRFVREACPDLVVEIAERETAPMPF